MNEELLIGAATPYLGIGGDQRLREIFEAAHTVMLAVLAAPQCADMTVKYMPFYVDALFKVFPQNISSQQFRMATKTLVRITTPPSPISANQPLLSSTLLELVRSRAQSASKEPLPQLTNAPSSSNEESHLSEQAVLVLTLIDSLPFLPVHILEEWLPLTAETLNLIQDQNMLPMCRQRFWEILSSGDMDVERAEVCVTWWCTRGGREMVLYSKGKEIQELVMSGGLGEASKL
ncbi:hypothetical protein MMC12_007285 [Toensbergia leucococca]|nr:hypothetical protein [Toensbergia leucococca]